MLISGNIPFKTEVASVAIYNQIQSDDTTLARRPSRRCCWWSRSLVLLVVDLAQRLGRPAVAKHSLRWIALVYVRSCSCCCRSGW